MSRPPRKPKASPIAPITPSYRRYLRRMGRTQVAFAALGLLVVCSLVAATLGTAVVDGLSGDNDDDPAEVGDAQDEREVELRTRVEGNPDDANAIVQLADLLANNGNLPEAITWYERAVALRPDDAATRFSFARSLQDGGKPADAELQFQRAIALNPTDAQAHYYLAQLYRDWDPPRAEEAVARYKEVIALGPDSVLADLARTELASLGVGTPVASGVSPAGTVEGTP